MALDLAETSRRNIGNITSPEGDRNVNFSKHNSLDKEDEVVQQQQYYASTLALNIYTCTCTCIDRYN